MMRITVIGCGYWGRNLVRNYYELGHLASVCDCSADGRAQARDLAADVAIFNDPRKAFDSAVDGVVIATPAETHFEIARAALLAGKDVMVEKPLALSCDEGAYLCTLAQERNRILMVGHVLEYHPAMVALRNLVRQGELGRVQYVYSNRLSLGKIRREENILWSFAPHDIAIILRLLGSMPLQVVACGGCYVQPNIADVTVSHMLFDNGVRAHIQVSWLHPFKEQRLVVIGQRKMASYDDVAKQLVVYDERVEVHEGLPTPFKGVGEEIAFDRSEPLRLECEAFVQAIATRRPPLTDAESGLRVLRVLDSCQRSLMMNGEPVALPVDVPSSRWVGAAV